VKPETGISTTFIKDTLNVKEQYSKDISKKNGQCLETLKGRYNFAEQIPYTTEWLKLYKMMYQRCDQIRYYMMS
jgi:hypothetical protein